jgi:hypothetical protein
MSGVQWAELGVFISVCASALVGLVFAMQKSSCDQINCCCGLIACHRPKDLIAKAQAQAKKDDTNINTNAPTEP